MNSFTLVIDSIDSTNYSANDLPIPRNIAGDTAVAMSQFKMSKSYGLFQNTSTLGRSGVYTKRQFVWTEAGTPLATATTAFDPSANYTATEFIDALATAMTAASAIDGGTLTYTGTFSTLTGKATISVSSGEFAYAVIDPLSFNSLFQRYLGLEPAGQASSSSVLEFSYPMRLQRYTRLNIESDICKDGLRTSLGYVDPTAVPFGSVISYEAKNLFDLKRVACNIPNQTSYQFRILDENNEVVDNQNIGFVLELLVQEV